MKRKWQSKLSLQLLFSIAVSYVITLFFLGILTHTIYRIEKLSPYFRPISAFAFFLGIVFFAVLFYLIVYRKIEYLKYISRKVMEIANKGFGTTIEIRGNDEISELCRNINAMSLELKNKFERERELEKSKNELIIGISHDLRTPLTSAKGYLQLLKDKKYQSDEELETYIQIAYDRMEMLEDLIEDLFEYTRLQGEIRLNKQRLCLNDILLQFVIDYGPLFEKERLALKSTIPQEKYYVEIDPDKFVRIMENLLGNALKYSLRPSSVWVSLSPEDQGVRLTVKNKTQPIDEENLSRLFDRFYRLEKSRSKETGGTGLGLSIAKRLVELHGGKIWADGEEDVIRLHVWLPVA
ncbi:sensor histidine kinase [Planifilum fimeticola]|jgi:signal transduction histidine kinase